MSEIAVLAEILDLDPDAEVDLQGLADELDSNQLDLTDPNNAAIIADLATCHGYR